MRHVLRSACLIAVSMMIPAYGDIVLNFDENGNGFININGAGFVADPGVLAPDPTGRVAGNVLIYSLQGQTVLAGDVRIFETSSVLSDVITFTNAAGTLNGNHGEEMIYYSDKEAGGGGVGDKADTGLPGSLTTHDGGGIPEVGPEGRNGFTYLGVGGQAGFPPGSTATYNGISDVPEPASLGWLVGGILLAGAGLRRRLM